MKRIICLLFSFCFLLFLLCGCEKEEKKEFTLKTPADYTIYRNDGKLAGQVGMNQKDLDNYVTKNHLLYLSSSKDNAVMVKLIGQKTSFSREIRSFSKLSEKNKAEIVNRFAQNSESADFIKGKGGNVFLRITAKTFDKKSDHQFAVTEYITVCAEKLYTFSVSADTNAVNPADELFNSLTINGPIQAAKKPFYLTAPFMIAEIALLTAAIAFLTFTVIRDLRPQKDAENEN